MIRTLTATRYVVPLREGGSVPAVVEADDDGTYVLKFRGAGQGPKALIAELVSGELARALGLPVPEIVFMILDEELSRSEPDEELQGLMQRSVGCNLALDYLPGSLNFDPLNVKAIDQLLASRIVWFDAYVTNVDRTPRNPNMLLWHRELWLIDHGASLYITHTWTDYMARSTSPFAAIRDHVLLPAAAHLDEADAELSTRLNRQLIESIAAQIPVEWLESEASHGFADVEAHRAAYVDYLVRRLESPRAFVEEAKHARAKLV